VSGASTNALTRELAPLVRSTYKSVNNSALLRAPPAISDFHLSYNMARPADPVLASRLFKADDFFARSRVKQRKRVVTGCNAVDEALRGGLDYSHGGLCCVSGEQGMGRTAVGRSCLQLLLLLSSPLHSASMNVFDVAFAWGIECRVSLSRQSHVLEHLSCHAHAHGFLSSRTIFSPLTSSPRPTPQQP